MISIKNIYLHQSNCNSLAAIIYSQLILNKKKPHNNRSKETATIHSPWRSVLETKIHFNQRLLEKLLLKTFLDKNSNKELFVNHSESHDKEKKASAKF